MDSPSLSHQNSVAVKHRQNSQSTTNTVSTKSVATMHRQAIGSSVPLRRLGLLVLGMKAALESDHSLVNAAKVKVLHTGEDVPPLSIEPNACATKTKSCYDTVYLGQSCTTDSSGSETCTPLYDDDPCPCESEVTMHQPMVAIWFHPERSVQYTEEGPPLEFDMKEYYLAPNQKGVFIPEGLFPIKEDHATLEALHVSDHDNRSTAMAGSAEIVQNITDGVPKIIGQGGVRGHKKSKGTCRAKACAQTGLILSISETGQDQDRFEAKVLSPGKLLIYYHGQFLPKTTFCKTIDELNKESPQRFKAPTPPNRMNAKIFCHPPMPVALKVLLALVGSGFGLAAVCCCVGKISESMHEHQRRQSYQPLHLEKNRKMESTYGAV